MGQYNGIQPAHQKGIARSVNSRRERTMPEKQTVERAKRDKRQGKAPTTQAGEFVREEMHHIREGKHGARSAKQAVAIGLSKARRAGVELPPPEKGTTSERTRRSAQHALRRSRSRSKPSTRRAGAVRSALRREGRAAASKSALARQARSAARKRGAGSLKAAARKSPASARM